MTLNTELIQAIASIDVEMSNLRKELQELLTMRKKTLLTILAEVRQMVLAEIQSGNTHPKDLHKKVMEHVLGIPIAGTEFYSYLSREWLNLAKNYLRHDGTIELTSDGRCILVENLTDEQAKTISGRRLATRLGMLRQDVVFNHKHGYFDVRDAAFHAMAGAALICLISYQAHVNAVMRSDVYDTVYQDVKTEEEQVESFYGRAGRLLEARLLIRINSDIIGVERDLET